MGNVSNLIYRVIVGPQKQQRPDDIVGPDPEPVDPGHGGGHQDEVEARFGRDRHSYHPGAVR